MSLIEAIGSVFGAGARTIADVDADLVELHATLPTMEQEVSKLAIEAVLSDDYGAARERGREYRMAQERLAALAAERAELVTADEKRIVEEKAKDAARVVKAARAKLGEWGGAVREIDDACGRIARFYVKADDAYGSLTSLLHDTPWPPGSWAALSDACHLAIEAALAGQTPPSIETAVRPIYEFVQSTLAQKDH